MEIDALDEFETRYPVTIDFPQTWNGREVCLFANLGKTLHETASSLKSIWMNRRCKSENDTWAGSKRCVDFYLTNKFFRPEVRIKAAVGSVALSDSEIPKFSSFEIPKLEIPFVFPSADFSSLYPQNFGFYQPVFNQQSFLEFDQTKFFNASQLNEFFSAVGTKLRTSNMPLSLTVPLEQSFTSIPLNPSEFPSLTVAQFPQYFGYLQQPAAHDFPVNIDSVMKFTQSKTNFNLPTGLDSIQSEIQSVITIASFHNTDKFASISSAQSKITIAQEAIAKAQAAIDARVLAESIPMPTTPTGLRCGQSQVDFLNWQANINNAKAKAEDLSKTAFQAITEAGHAINSAVSTTQIAAPLMQTAIQLIAGTTVLAAASTGLPLVPQVLTLAAITNFFPKTELDTRFGAELATSLNQYFEGLPDNSSPSSTLPTATPLTIESLYESLGVTIPEYLPLERSLRLNLFPPEKECPKMTRLREPDAEFAAHLAIDDFFSQQKNRVTSIGPFNNYASNLAHIKPESPFEEVPFLGFRDQSTIHFHCGIYNNFPEIVEAGLCFANSLNKELAVQPHLIHSHNIGKGLIFVLFEIQKDRLSELKAKGVPVQTSSVGALDFTLENSKITEAIEYEVATFSQIAEQIIATGNPNLKQVHVFFSNGGYVCREALKLLPPEYRDTIIVITAGTTAIIGDGLAHKVYNFIGDLDFPSQACNGEMAGIEKAIQDGADVRIIPQTETQNWVNGHYFMQPDYQDKIADLIRKLRTNYEIY